MFDALIREISQRFGLGDKAQDLVTSLLALIFDPNSGGIHGLAAKLQQQGLGDLLSTWLGGSAGPATAITPQQVENVLGSSQLSGIADKLGVARGTVVAAASAALPKIISVVSANGQLPTEIPAAISGMVGELGGLDGADTGVAGAAASAMASTASSTASSMEGAAGGGLGWLKWLILAAIVLALGYCMMNRKAETPPAPPAAAVPAPAPTPPPAPAPAPAPAQETAAPAAAAPAAATDAKTALSALAPGKFSAEDLVKAMNLMIVHFDTGSATISTDSIDVLTDAASALKAAPAGSKVEIGGHTDNTGDAAANLKLSDERANAVRNKLTELGVAADALSAKGYGDTKPVADNATEEGRAKNRRIEFSVQH